MSQVFQVGSLEGADRARAEALVEQRGRAARARLGLPPPSRAPALVCGCPADPPIGPSLVLEDGVSCFRCSR